LISGTDTSMICIYKLYCSFPQQTKGHWFKLTQCKTNSKPGNKVPLVVGPLEYIDALII